MQGAKVRASLHASQLGMLQQHAATTTTTTDQIGAAQHNAATVHVTSYLNFAAEIHGLPSRNSVNALEIFRRASTPALQTGHGNVPTAKHFPRNTLVSRWRRDRLHPAGESGLAT